VGQPRCLHVFVDFKCEEAGTQQVNQATLTSIGRLMGSGGGVPDHATYVTQRIGSGWYLPVYDFSVESQRFQALNRRSKIAHCVRLSTNSCLTLTPTLC
jgi:hypothetical protein